MKLAGGIAANIASQGYIALLGIFCLPIYLHFLGDEAFGLIALSLTLQAWFVIFDFGLAPTLTRAVVMHRAEKITSPELRALLRDILWIYAAIGFAALAVLAIAAVTLSERWFRKGLLSTDELLCTFLALSLVMVLRWFADLLRSVHVGAERFVWLSKFNSIIATLRLLLVVPLLALANAGVVTFFAFQLVVALLECGLLAYATRGVVPAVPVPARVQTFQQLRKLKHFALTMALVGSCWVLVSQTDKVLLSGLMTLSEFGQFGLATTAASAVLLATTPLSAVVLPRMTALIARNDHDAFRRIYSYATQWLALAAWPTTAILTLHAERILLAWTGDPVLATTSAPVLQFYALGNGILSVCSIAYLGQFARGDLKLHVLGSTVFLLLLLPLVTWCTSRFGPVGAGGIWLLLNSAYLSLWLLIVHRKFGPYPYRRWLFQDVLPPALLAFASSALGLYLPWSTQRIWLIGQILLWGLLTLAVASLGTSWAREAVSRRHLPVVVGAEAGGEPGKVPTDRDCPHG